MRSIAVLLLLFSITITTFSQDIPQFELKNIEFQIKSGLNFCKLYNDTNNLKKGVTPLLGIQAKTNLYDNIYTSSSISYSIKNSSHVSPFYKIKNNYIDLDLLIQYNIAKDLFVNSGLMYSHLLKSYKITNSSENENGVQKNEINNYNSELSIPIGFEYKIQNNINLGCYYYFPTTQKSTKNFQVQINYSLRKRDKNHKTLLEIASRQQIMQLKNGVLLVRLRTSINKINALKKMDCVKEAKETEEQQLAENKKIISAFKNNFDFCKVLFFYSYNSENVLNKKFNGVFLDDNLNENDSITIDSISPYFIAEFTTTEQDTSKYFSHYSYSPENGEGYKRQKNYYTSSSDFSFYALVIKDNKFIQLNKPFPYYTRAIHMSMKQHPEQAIFIFPLFFTKLSMTFDNTVKKMNDNLYNFYENERIK